MRNTIRLKAMTAVNCTLHIRCNACNRVNTHIRGPGGRIGGDNEQVPNNKGTHLERIRFNQK